MTFDLAARFSPEFPEFTAAAPVDSHADLGLAASLAHDVNNLLTAIIGYGDLLELDLGNDAAVHEDVREMRAAADRAARLVEQILGLVRLPGRRDAARRTDANLQQAALLKCLATCDPIAAVQAMRGIIEHLVGESVAVSLDLDPRVGRVGISVQLIDRMLANLASNARDAMGAGGCLQIALHCLKIEDSGRLHFQGDSGSATDEELQLAESGGLAMPLPGDYVVLRVRDTGDGISKDALSRVFEPLFTTRGGAESSAESTSERRGTGLGLANVAEIAAGAGGSVRVSSVPGAGATFWILLPRVEGADDRARLAGPMPLRQLTAHSAASIR